MRSANDDGNDDGNDNGNSVLAKARSSGGGEGSASE